MSLKNTIGFLARLSTTDGTGLTAFKRKTRRQLCVYSATWSDETGQQATRLCSVIKPTLIGLSFCAPSFPVCLHSVDRKAALERAAQFTLKIAVHSHFWVYHSWKVDEL